MNCSVSATGSSNRSDQIAAAGREPAYYPALHEFNLSIGSYVRETHVRFVDQDLGAAWAESQKLRPGFARGEDYLRRLKSIKTGYALPELKQALDDYIAAYERALIAMEAGRDAPKQSKAMAEARERMLGIARKYQ